MSGAPSARRTSRVHKSTWTIFSSAPRPTARTVLHDVSPPVILAYTRGLTGSALAASARVARSARALKVGTLRPAIVLYDEPHPLGDDIGSMHSADITRKPDMLIIMGTSLKVHGFKKLVKDFARAVHESAPSPAVSPPKKNAKSFAGKVIFVNKTAPGSEWDGIIDYHVAGETDRWVEKVIEDWKKARPSDWEVQKTLVAASESSTAGTFHVAKEITNTVGLKGKGTSPRAQHRRRR